MFTLVVASGNHDIRLHTFITAVEIKGNSPGIIDVLSLNKQIALPCGSTIGTKIPHLNLKIILNESRVYGGYEIFFEGLTTPTWSHAVIRKLIQSNNISLFEFVCIL